MFLCQDTTWCFRKDTNFLGEPPGLRVFVLLTRKVIFSTPKTFEEFGRFQKVLLLRGLASRSTVSFDDISDQTAANFAGPFRPTGRNSANFCHSGRRLTGWKSLGQRKIQGVNSQMALRPFIRIRGQAAVLGLRA